MRVLITGANGFVGSALLEELVKLDDIKIIALFHKNPPTYSESHSGKVEWMRCNLLEDKFEFLARDFDLIYHLAAASPNGINDDLSEFKFLNEDATIRFARSAKLRNIPRFIYVSSISACEYSLHKIVDEVSGFPKSRYGVSKRNAENLLLELHDKNFSVTIVRPTAIVGLNHKGSIYELVKAIKEKKFIYIGSLHTRLNFIFLQDFIFDLLSITWCDEAHGEIFISSDNPITIKNLVEIIMTELSCEYSIKRIPRTFGILIGMLADMLNSIFHLNLPISMRRVLAMTRDVEYSSTKINKLVQGRCKIGISTGISLVLKFYVVEKWV